LTEYFLDVNVVMYAAGKPHPYKEPCLEVLKEIQNGHLKAYIDVGILQELPYRYHATGLGEKGAELAWDILETGVEVLDITKKDMELALFYFQKYRTLSPRDAIYIGVMVNHDLKEIISTDRHFDQVEELKRRDPKEWNR